MKNKRRYGLICLIMVCILLVGCGAKKSKSESDVSVAPREYSEQDYSENNDATVLEDSKSESALYNTVSETGTYAEDTESPNSSTNTTVTNNRKIIKTVSMSLETQNFTDDIALIEKKISTLGGYIEMQTMDDLLSDSGRMCNLTARIPADKLDTFVNTVSKTGNVVSKSLTTDDVTLSYVDTESRVKVLKAEQDRLLALIEKAETMEAIITLESRLTDIRYELESNQSQLRMYDNLVDYSTVTITINEVYHYTPKPEKVKTTWDRIQSGFNNTLKDIKNTITEFIVGVVINLPYLVILLLVVLFVIIVIKSVNKKLNKKVSTNQSNNTNNSLNQNSYQNMNINNEQDNINQTNHDDK